MIVKINEDRFNSLLTDATAFERVIGSLVFTEIVKMGKTVAICIGTGDAQQFLEQE